MQITLILVGASVLFGTLAYTAYFADIIRKDPISPNRWSWLVWSVATMVEALTYEAVSSDLVKALAFIVSAICCIVITVTIWGRSKWKRPDWSEMLCVAASVVALVLWLCFRLTLFAHILVVVAVPVAFIPTWKDAWRHPQGELSMAWVLWTIGDLLALSVIILRYDSLTDLPYAVVEFLCHGAMWLIVTARLARTKKGVH